MKIKIFFYRMIFQGRKCQMAYGTFIIKINGICKAKVSLAKG